MQTYDDLDLFAMQWLLLMVVLMTIVGWIGSRLDARKARKVLPNPTRLAVRDNGLDRYYRITPTDRTVK